MTKTYELPNGTKVKVTAKNKRVAKKFMNAEHYAYTITIEVGDKMFKTTYHDSIRNYNIGKGATEEMIDTALDCILMDYDSYDYNPGLSDFMDEYGYDPEDDNGEKVYKACKATFDALNAMFTRQELEDLTNMVDR
jgi:hypothetical protein